MQVEIKLDPNCQEPRIVVVTAQVDEKIYDLVQQLSQQTPAILSGFRGEEAKILDQSELLRVYSSGGKVMAVMTDGEYVVKMRLYEVEKRLDKRSFVRISHSEIINLKQVKKFDLSYTGTICVCFLDGSTSYVSRRNVAKIKEVLGL